MAYLAIGSLALLPIYAASHAALRRPGSAPPPGEGDEKETSIIEKIDSTHALLFPVFAGVTLISFYLMMIYFSKEWLNFFFSAYFCVIGFGSNFQAMKSVLGYYFPALMEKVPKYHLPISESLVAEKGDSSISCSVIDVVIGLVCFVLSIQLSRTNHWILVNIFGTALSFNAIQLIGLDSFKTGMILLAALFFYDIYFVFGTKIMVTVAQGIEAPIKVLWPKDLINAFNGPTMMLGLGDIVLPGIYVALSLRFDLYQYHQKHTAIRYRKGWYKFPKPYFTLSILFYMFGLASTITALHIFSTAQPALLYLSPLCILSTLITGWHLDELGEVWKYADREESAVGEKRE